MCVGHLIAGVLAVAAHIDLGRPLRLRGLPSPRRPHPLPQVPHHCASHQLAHVARQGRVTPAPAFHDPRLRLHSSFPPAAMTDAGPLLESASSCPSQGFSKQPIRVQAQAMNTAAEQAFSS